MSASSSCVHVCDGARQDADGWKRQYRDIQEKLDKACAALEASSAYERGHRDGRFFDGARKLRMPMGNRGAAGGYRVVYVAIDVKGAVHVIVAAIYPKVAYADNNVPAKYLARIRTEVEAKIAELVPGQED